MSSLPPPYSPPPSYTSVCVPVTVKPASRQKNLTILFFGLPLAGTSTIAKLVAEDQKMTLFKFEGQKEKRRPWDEICTMLDSLHGLISSGNVAPRGLVLDIPMKNIEEFFMLYHVLESSGMGLHGAIFVDDQGACKKRAIAKYHSYEDCESYVNGKYAFYENIASGFKNFFAESDMLYRVENRVGEVDPMSQNMKLTIGDIKTILVQCLTSRHPPPRKPKLCGTAKAHFVSDFQSYRATMEKMFKLFHNPKKSSCPVARPITTLSEERWRGLLVDRLLLARPSLSDDRCVVMYHTVEDPTSKRQKKFLQIIPQHMRCIFTVPEEQWEFNPKVECCILHATLTTVKNTLVIVAEDVLVWDGKPVLQKTFDERVEPLRFVSTCNLPCFNPIPDFGEKEIVLRFLDSTPILDVVGGIHPDFYGGIDSFGLIVFPCSIPYSLFSSDETLLWQNPSKVRFALKATKKGDLWFAEASYITNEEVPDARKVLLTPLPGHAATINVPFAVSDGAILSARFDFAAKAWVAESTLLDRSTPDLLSLIEHSGLLSHSVINTFQQLREIAAQIQPTKTKGSKRRNRRRQQS